MKTIRERVEALLTNPVYASLLIHDARPYGLRNIQSVKAGEKLMEPVGSPEHRTTVAFGDSPDDIDYKFSIDHIGYWRRVSRTVIYLRVPFRDMTPVWAFSLSGSFAPEIVQVTDRDEWCDGMEDFLSFAARERFARKEKYGAEIFFRVPPYEKDGWRYTSTTSGTWEQIVGHEIILYKEKPIWHAAFVGCLTTAINDS